MGKQERRGFKQYPELTQVTIFDLEFYVPLSDRESERSDLRANPFREGHFLMGGTFLDWFPLVDDPDDPPQPEGCWIWDHEDSEFLLLKTIYQRFLDHWALATKKHDQCDPIVVGIGISRVDIGYLFARCLQLEIATPEELFRVFYQLRIIDLENAGLAVFKSKNRLLYPKSTKELLNKSGIEKARKPGMAVWDAYDSEDFGSIEDRTTEEVIDMYFVYRFIRSYLWKNNLAKKYSTESIRKMMQGLSSPVQKKSLLDNLVRKDDDHGTRRWHIPCDSKEASLLRTAELIYESEYWKR